MGRVDCIDFQLPLLWSQYGLFLISEPYYLSTHCSPNSSWFPDQQKNSKQDTSINQSHVLNCFERTTFSYSLIENFIWIEPILRSNLSYKPTLSLSQKWPLNTGLNVSAISDRLWQLSGEFSKVIKSAWANAVHFLHVKENTV